MSCGGISRSRLRDVLEEYAQGVPNFGYDPDGPTNPWAFYPIPALLAHRAHVERRIARY